MRIDEILEDYNFKVFYSSFSTSFEIISKGEKNLVIKICKNIDGLDKNIYEDLKNLSCFLGFQSIVVGEKTSRKKLDKAIYFRRNLMVVPANFFEDFLLGNIKVFYSYGKKLVFFNNEKMKERRKELKISLNKLSKMVNVSRRSLYEIEKGITKPCIETARKIENVLKIKLIENVDFATNKKYEYIFYKTSFIKGIEKENEKIIVPKEEGIEEAKKLSKFLDLKII